MTEKQYRKEIVNLSKTENFSVADNAFIEKIDMLSDSLKKMILDNTDDLVSLNGTTYYVSNDGNDNLDGKSPKTAIATLKKLNELELDEGDAVVFRRGDIFRGNIVAKSGVSYSATVAALAVGIAVTAIILTTAIFFSSLMPVFPLSLTTIPQLQEILT